jgi:hypothetical protein
MTTVTKMRLSKETFNVLKNFAAINSNVLIKPGNRLKTISIGKNIFVEAIVQEEFDTQIAIWDLNKFLGAISMFSNPDLEFYDTHVDISNGRSSVRYFYSEPSLLTVPTKDIKMPDVLFSFDLEEQDINEIIKAASILQVGDLVISADDKTLKIVVNDSSNNSSNSFEIVVDENYDGPSYEGTLKVSDLKILPGSYTISLTKTVIVRFTHKSQNLSYYITTTKG